MTRPADDIMARYPQLATRQRMAPLMQRIIEYMEAANAPIGADALAPLVFGGRAHVRKHIRKLHNARIIRIAGWSEKPPGVCGDYCRLFELANGKPDEQRPARPERSTQLKTWRGRLRTMLGDKYKFVARSANGGGAETLVLHGRVVYQRYHGVRYDALRQVYERETAK